jgi:hypothetical protein
MDSDLVWRFEGGGAIKHLGDWAGRRESSIDRNIDGIIIEAVVREKIV